MDFNDKDSSYNDKTVKPLQDSAPSSSAQEENENETGQVEIKNNGNEKRTDLRAEAKANTKEYATKMRSKMKGEIDNSRSLDPNIKKEVSNPEEGNKEEQERDKEEKERLAKESRDIAQNPGSIEDWFHKPVPEPGFLKNQGKDVIASEVETNFDKYMGKINEYIHDPGMINDAKNIIKNILTRYYFVEDGVSGDGTTSFAKGLGKKLEPLFFNFKALQQSYPQQFPTTQSVLESFSEFAGIPLIVNGRLNGDNFTKIVLMKGKPLNDLFVNFSQYAALSASLSATPQSASPTAESFNKGEKPDSSNPKPHLSEDGDTNDNYDADDDQNAAEKPGEQGEQSESGSEKPGNLSEQKPDVPSQTPGTTISEQPAPAPTPKFQTIPDSPTPTPSTGKDTANWLEKWFNNSPFMKGIVDFLKNIVKFFKGL